jgi:hypothetical protein
MTDKEGRVQVWSCGGGTQSVAIGVLIAQGKIQKPDFAAIMDTHYEMPSTWDYLENHLNPFLKKHAGFEVERVSCREWGGRDISEQAIYLPMFADQGRVRYQGVCSREWKRDALRRYLSDSFPKRLFTQQIGFSTDELRRVRVTAGKWQNTYPLIDLRLNRWECIRLVEQAGLPTPPRSACYICPNRTDGEWSEMTPDLIDKARSVEARVQEESNLDWAPEIFLHRSCAPIDQAVFSDSTDDLFAGCDSGMCFV